MSDRATLGALLQALAQTRPDATVSDFDQAARPEAYAMPMDRRPATMRAPTYAERLRGLLESGARTVTEQPVGRILDILLSGGGVRSMADAQSPPLVSMGEASKPTQKTLAAEVAKRVPNPIKAYHGSPHDFDQFSMEKIGTGEGAQAYGHGLYFAQAEPTARTYRDNITQNRVAAAQRALAASGQDVDAALASARAEIARIKSLPNAGGDAAKRDRFIALNEEKIAELSALKNSGGMSKGRMYEVNIHADPESFLDWDKPLSQQPAGSKLRPSVVRETEPSDSKWLVQVNGQTVNGFNTKKAANAYVETMTGGDFQQSWHNRRGIDTSKDLQAQGIPGIKYLDQNSRSAGEGSRNYVVFDDSLIEILRKYGLLPFAAGLGAAGKDQR